MSVSFTHVPTTSRQHLAQYVSSAAAYPIVESAFSNIVIDGPAGVLTNMDVAAEAARLTSNAGIVLTHWSGVLHPGVAARQLAALDSLSEGRLALRMLIGPDGTPNGFEHPPGHVEALRQADEYLVLLKRLWSNHEPFDHEGPHYSVRNGYVAQKGPQGADIPIRMGGVSGIAVDVAARHATVFELSGGSPGEIRNLVERVRSAAARYGRTGKIGFALPVLLAPGPEIGSDAAHGPARLSGSPEQIARSLQAYAALGIDEFMLSGVDDRQEIAAFSTSIAPVFQRTALFRPRQTAPLRWHGGVRQRPA